MILFAERLLDPELSVLPDAGVVVAGGRIVRVLRGRAALVRAERSEGRRARRLDGLLAPGFVNAHAHLELSGLEGALPGGRGFAAWIRGVIDARARLRPRDYARGVAEGARRLLATGTTTVGDIASAEAGACATRGRLRAVVYREVLDAWNEERTASALRPVRRALPARRLRREGISPHAPYTTSSALLSSVRELVRRRSLPVSVHWSETSEETEWLTRGAGPFARILGDSPRRSGLELLESAGLLSARTSLVHGNHPRRGEPGRLARHGVTLVHCPGTHRFFGRPRFPWARYRRAGVPIALGTDSLASNGDLDLGREMALLRAEEPGLTPREVLAAVTVAAARALGMAGEGGGLTRTSSRFGYPEARRSRRSPAGWERSKGSGWEAAGL